MHARYGHEVARARAAKVCPMLLAEAEALAESERSQQRRAVGVAARGADALGELAAKLQPPRPRVAAGRCVDGTGPDVPGCTVAVDEQPLLVVEAAGITRTARRPQARREHQRITGLHALRRLVPREAHARRHAWRPRRRDVEWKRNLPRRYARKSTDRAREREVVAERGYRQALGQPLAGAPPGPRNRRGQREQRPQHGVTQRGEHCEQQRHAPQRARQHGQLVHCQRTEQPRAGGPHDRCGLETAGSRRARA